MGLNRYFVPKLPSTGSIELPPEETHHAMRVRRETVGGRCVAFDGRGHVAMCHIIQASKHAVAIEVESYRFEPNEPPGWVRLAVALPKRDRQRAVIEKAVELGIHELVPLVCHRSVSLPNDSASEKWHRTVVEACKQCERNRLMTIAAPSTFEFLTQDKLSENSTVVGKTLRMFAHPRDRSLDANGKPISLYDRVDTNYSNVTIAIGPEGGFTNAEIQSAMDAGWNRLDLGPRILRVETAVCASSIYASLCIEMSGS